MGKIFYRYSFCTTTGKSLLRSRQVIMNVGHKLCRCARRWLMVSLWVGFLVGLSSSLVASRPSISEVPRGHRYIPHHRSVFCSSGRRALTEKVLTVGRGGGSTTQLESSAFVVLDTFMKGNPLISAAIICATKASLADLVAQKRQQKLGTSDSGDKWDTRRTLAFTTYGALYQGAVQELIYNNFYTFLFGSATTARVVIRKVLFDAVFHNALVCIPMAYAVKSLIFNKPVLVGIRQYIDDVRYHGLLLKYYTMWMPVNAMIFTIVPTHWRIPVMAVVSFFWMIILSTISSRSREKCMQPAPSRDVWTEGRL